MNLLLGRNSQGRWGKGREGLKTSREGKYFLRRGRERRLYLAAFGAMC